MNLLDLVNGSVAYVGSEGSEPSNPPWSAEHQPVGTYGETGAYAGVEEVLGEDRVRRRALVLRPGRRPRTVVRVPLDLSPHLALNVFRVQVGLMGSGMSSGRPPARVTADVWVGPPGGETYCLLRTVAVADGALQDVEIDVSHFARRGPYTIWLGLVADEDPALEEAVLFVAPRLESRARPSVVMRPGVQLLSVTRRGESNESGRTEPYLYARVVVLDGFGLDAMALDRARFRILDAGGDVGLGQGGTRARFDLHDNLPSLGRGGRGAIAPELGDIRFDLKGVEPPDPASGLRLRDDTKRDVVPDWGLVRVGVVVLLMEEDDSPTSTDVARAVADADRQLQTRLDALLRQQLLRLVPGREGVATSVTGAVQPVLDGFWQVLFEHATYLRRSIRDRASWPLNPDDHLGTHVKVLDLEQLLAAGAIGAFESLPLGGHDLGLIIRSA